MEALTRLVTDSLARHGFDRPVDPRRLQWSRWFRCDSPHSLLVVPSKPGVFALAEEVMDLGAGTVAAPMTDREGHDFSRAARRNKGIRLQPLRERTHFATPLRFSPPFSGKRCISGAKLAPPPGLLLLFESFSSLVSHSPAQCTRTRTHHRPPLPSAPR
jgi:hypothetical protein